MELAKQVTSHPISKQILDLGFKKESYFEHKCHYPDGKFICTRYSPKDGDCDTEDMKIQIPAYTASELMEYLPAEIKYNKSDYSLEVYKLKNSYQVSYSGYKYGESDSFFREADTLADALGQMLIYLLSNNLIDGNN